MSEQRAKNNHPRKSTRRLSRQPARKLSAIVIDDDTRSFESLEGREGFIELNVIDSYVAAQNLLLQHRQSVGRRGGDLFLVDIDFAKSKLPNNLEWGSYGALKPFGPLLALPFLGREICTFVPYSSYWNDEHIYKNGFVLVATSLILAATEQRAIRLNDVRREIDESEGECSFGSTVGFALSDALAKYRAVLANPERVELLDIARTNRQLEALVERIKRGDEVLSLPLQDENGILSINFSYLPFHLESLELTSVFADLFNFNLSNDLSVFQRIIEILKGWEPISNELGGYRLPEAAQKLLDITEGLSHDSDESLSFDQALGIVMQGSPLLEEHAVKRIAMMFAWVKAWCEDCFEEIEAFHSEVENERASLINRVHTTLSLDKKDSAILYKRLLAGKGGREVSTKRWRTPFKLEGTYEGVNDAYQLDEDKPSALTTIERFMCIQYAKEVLFWDGLKVPYPRWMIE
jgi:hypothetical protein